MRWCNCIYDDSYFFYNTDPSMDTHITCTRCGDVVNSETMIILLLKQTLKLIEKVEQLEIEKQDREIIKMEEENIKMEEEIEREEVEQAYADNFDKNTERFRIIDL